MKATTKPTNKYHSPAISPANADANPSHSLDPALLADLDTLQLPYLRDHAADLAAQAARETWDPLRFLALLIRGQVEDRLQRSTERRLKDARFPVQKSLADFDWTWPKSIDRPAIEALARCDWIGAKVNLVLAGPVGVGKTHLAIALGTHAVLRGHRVLFCPAIDLVNTLSAAATSGSLQSALRRFTAPDLLVLDELGYLPIDARGADLLFQVISARYERASILLTTNRAFKDWAPIFNNDPATTSAVLDRLLHHLHLILIDGPSFRMKDHPSNNP